MKCKRPRVLRYHKEGDGRSFIFADADWSDEINHVRYGQKWTDYFLRDDVRTVEDIKQEIAEYLARRAGGGGRAGTECGSVLTPGTDRATETTIGTDRSMQ